MDAHTQCTTKYCWFKRLALKWFREFCAIDTSMSWTKAQCPACQRAITAPTAAYCAWCGASLAPAPAPTMILSMPFAPVVPTPTPPSERLPPETDGYNLNMRPFVAYTQMRHKGAGTHTATTVAITLQKLRNDGDEGRRRES